MAVCRCNTPERCWILTNTFSVLNYVFELIDFPSPKTPHICQAPGEHPWCILSFTCGLFGLVWKSNFQQIFHLKVFLKNLFDAQCSVFEVHFWINKKYCLNMSVNCIFKYVFKHRQTYVIIYTYSNIIFCLLLDLVQM